jgi:hypothetical protein
MLIGKRLLCTQGHTAQRSEQHRPGSFAQLTFTQSNPSAKSPMPLSCSQGHHCCARFWPKLFADVEETKFNKFTSLRAIASTTDLRELINTNENKQPINNPRLAEPLYIVRDCSFLNDV